ncbi:MAG: DUF429 domain-containing protein [Chloroflexota bacterium]
MLFTSETYIGIDPSRGKKAISYTALNKSLEPVGGGKGELAEVVAFIGGQQQAVVGVVGPSALNQQILMDPERRTALLIPISRGRPGDMRVAEHLLKQRGLPVYRTPSSGGKIPGWMETAFGLHGKLHQLGFAGSGADPTAERMVIECVPEVCFRAWISGEIMAANLFFGRLQRQLCLYNLGVDIADPMDFFEEITRHRVLHGQVPEGDIWSPSQVQCFAAAYLAWQAKNQPDQVGRVGVVGEGFITVPAVLIEEKL